MDVAQWTQRYQESIMNTFGCPQTVLTRGAGCFVWDEDGRQYLDLLGGIAVNALGHGHPALVKALSDQAQTLGHISNFFASSTQIEAAEKLLSIVEPVPVPGARVFFCNSGTEANEAAFKLARVYAGEGRKRFLAVENAFHGRTMGSLSLTYKSAYRDQFHPLPAQVDFLPYGSLAALERAFENGRGDDVAALFIEPIQGEAGVRPVSDNYLRLAREVTQHHGVLLILDEVQTGMGRTGSWMAHHSSGIIPDVITLAKGLGAGFPVGATVALNPQAAAALRPGMHGSTFAGNPLAAAAVLALIDTVEQEKLLENVALVGQTWAQDLMNLHHSAITEVRGAGLLMGLGLSVPVAPALSQELFRRGFIVNAPDLYTIRLAPPLIITVEQTRMFTSILSETLDWVVREEQRKATLPRGGKDV